MISRVVASNDILENVGRMDVRDKELDEKSVGGSLCVWGFDLPNREPSGYYASTVRRGSIC